MKNCIKILIVALLIGLVISCKSDKKSKVENEINNEVVEPVIKVKNEVKVDNDKFSIKLELVSSEAGLFQVLYNSEELNKWQKKYFKINKSEEPQTIEANFDLNKYGYPKQIRFILGGETPKQVIIKEFFLSGGDNIININSNNFDKFIIGNECVKFNKENNTISTIEVKDTHVPIMVLSNKALDSLTY
jgi:hypothetical protein